jgi:hypothetical protein
LNAKRLVVRQQNAFDVLRVSGGFVYPGLGGLFFDAFDPMDSGEAIAFGDHRQTLRDSLLGMAQAIEESAPGRREHLLADFALEARNALLGLSELS